MHSFEIKEKLRSEMEKLKKNNKSLFEQLGKKMDKILENPELSKPLGNILSGTRRAHIGHFVLIYEIVESENKIVFLKFAHHDYANG